MSTTVAGARTVKAAPGRPRSAVHVVVAKAGRPEITNSVVVAAEPANGSRRVACANPVLNVETLAVPDCVSTAHSRSTLLISSYIATPPRKEAVYMHLDLL